MMDGRELFGEGMALLAAVIWSWTAILFTAAANRLGVTAVNVLRMALGAACLSLAHLAFTGRLWPAGLDAGASLWLGLSGIVGLTLGDWALFHAFTVVGPRRALMLMATAPVFTVLSAWFLLGEKLGPLTLLGIVVVIAGVLVAVAGRERARKAPPAPGAPGVLAAAAGGAAGGAPSAAAAVPRSDPYSGLPRSVLRAGLLWALVGAAGQGFGSTFAKRGMLALDPLAATLVRMTWAAAAGWAVVLLQRRAGRVLGRLGDRRGMRALGAAVLLGPFVSVWISLVAIKHAPAGVAQVLLGTTPIWVILPSWLVYRDRPSLLSLAGVVIAVAGGALLFAS